MASSTPALQYTIRPSTLRDRLAQHAAKKERGEAHPLDELDIGEFPNCLPAVRPDLPRLDPKSKFDFKKRVHRSDRNDLALVFHGQIGQYGVLKIVSLTRRERKGLLI